MAGAAQPAPGAGGPGSGTGPPSFPNFPNFPNFNDTLHGAGLPLLRAESVSTLQVNLGSLCNLSCRHCHVGAGPKRLEVMSRATMELCINAVGSGSIREIDITGGAPEMNPSFRWFLSECAATGARVKTRTNLAILGEDGYLDLPGFFAELGVEVIASLPYYAVDKTDRMRGEGVFEASIAALGALNRAGYGGPLVNDGVNDGDDGLRQGEGQAQGLFLNLVYNPAGAFLPGAQEAMEADFRRELSKRHGVTFSNLFTLTNLPVGRFLSFLEGTGNLAPYMEKLVGGFNPSAATKTMCRTTLSVGWEGSLYDCDFNQMLGLGCTGAGQGAGQGSRRGAASGNSLAHIKDFDRDIGLLGCREIVTGPHCYGCTAGSGSSCGGATTV